MEAINMQLHGFSCATNECRNMRLELLMNFGIDLFVNNFHILAIAAILLHTYFKFLKHILILVKQIKKLLKIVVNR